MDRYVLVVDDFEDGREMLAEYLAFRGFTVVTASDGAEAIALATKRPPAVILMDLTMPGTIDGWEATRRLKAHRRTKDSLILAVTANALSSDDAKARAAGCDGFIAKPFDLSRLAKTLTRLIGPGRPGAVRGGPTDSRTRRRRRIPES